MFGLYAEFHSKSIANYLFATHCLFTAIFLITCSVYVVSKITINYVDGNRMFCKKVMFDIKSGLKDNLNYNVWQSLIFRGQKCNKSAAFLNWKNRMFGFPLLYG